MDWPSAAVGSVDSSKLVAIMVAGGVFALAGLFLLLRPTQRDAPTLFKLFGFEFRFTSAGIVVFLVGAAFLLAPVYVKERPAPTPPPSVGTPGGSVISLPPPVEGSEAEPNSHISQANQIEIGKTYQGTLREGDTDFFVLQTPNAGGQVIRLIARIKGGYMDIASFNERQEKIYYATRTDAISEKFVLHDTPIHFIRFSTSSNFVSYEFELRPEPSS